MDAGVWVSERLVNTHASCGAGVQVYLDAMLVCPDKNGKKCRLW